MFVTISISFSLTLITIRALKPIATYIGLLDKPGERKQHQGVVPLIGGISLYLSFAISNYFFLPAATDFYYWLIGGGLLVLTGAIDDKYDISVRIRVLAAISAALIIIVGADTALYNLGNLFGLGEIIMPVWLATPFTIIAVFGIINALNMCDGIDGMAASLVIISLISLGCLVGLQPATARSLFSFVAALLAFLVYNLRLTPRVKKVFLGDAGSMLLGYSLMWILIAYCQDTEHNIQQFAPVTGLFIIGLPLIDMVTTVVRRVNKGVNPFRPDRTHVHHILLHAGFSHRQTLAIIVGVGSIISGTGVILHTLNTPEAVQLLIYFVVFGIYYKSVKHAFKLSGLLQRIHGKRTAA